MDCWFCGHELIWSGDFDYEDFELLSREDLIKEYPQHEFIIKRLT